MRKRLRRVHVLLTIKLSNFATIQTAKGEGTVTLSTAHGGSRKKTFPLAKGERMYDHNLADYLATVNEDAADLLTELHEEFNGEKSEAVLRLLRTKYPSREEQRALEILENDEWTKEEWE